MIENLDDRNYNIAAALVNICPGTSWVVENNTYEGIKWYSDLNLKPSKQVVEAEVNRLKAAWENSEYQRLRQIEYPPITDYLDGVVKGDQQQIADYITACQAVKAKYPKPE